MKTEYTELELSELKADLADKIRDREDHLAVARQNVVWAQEIDAQVTDLVKKIYG